MAQSINERVSWENVVRLENEIEQLRARIAELETGVVITTSKLIHDARDVYDIERVGNIAEIHIVQQQQHAWIAASGEARLGVNRLTIEGARVRRMYIGSTIENLHGQLMGTARPDVSDYLYQSLDVE